MQRAIELQPEEPVIMDSYGWLLFRQGKAEQALSFLQQAYDKEKEAEIAAHLIEVLWFLRRYDEARQLFKQAMGLIEDKEYLLELQKRITDLK